MLNYHYKLILYSYNSYIHLLSEHNNETVFFTILRFSATDFLSFSPYLFQSETNK